MRVCPRCKGVDFWHLSTGQWRCQHCGLTRYFRQRTYWQISKISPYWKGRLVEFFALGVPAYRLRFVIPISQPTVQRFFRLLRYLIYQQTMKELEPFIGILELDETMFGGKRKGKRGWGAYGKQIVFGIYKRNGKVMTFPVSSRKTETLIPLITTYTKPGSLYYTDDWFAYAQLGVRGDHVVVTKEKGVPKGRDHLNGIEGFWSYAKHWLYRYRGVPGTYFPHYLKECEWRFNHRDQNLVPLLRKLLNQRVVKERV